MGSPFIEQEHCHLHPEFDRWKEKVDRCLWDMESGLVVSVTRLVESMKTMQKIVYGAVAVALLSFATALCATVIINPGTQLKDVKDELAKLKKQVTVEQPTHGASVGNSHSVLP